MRDFKTLGGMKRRLKTLERKIVLLKDEHERLREDIYHVERHKSEILDALKCVGTEHPLGALAASIKVPARTITLIKRMDEGQKKRVSGMVAAHAKRFQSNVLRARAWAQATHSHKEDAAKYAAYAGIGIPAARKLLTYIEENG